MEDPSRKRKQEIIAGGRDHAYWAALRAVRAEVQRDFAEALSKAGFVRRVLLWFRMEREVRRRLEQRPGPPWDALHGRSGGAEKG
ncbi:MAG: hypothetical protein HY721_33965 [Planctomycetes bacterium]|nr:hypothetical protein [Planctomycetota bacterium]